MASVDKVFLIGLFLLGGYFISKSNAGKLKIDVEEDIIASFESNGDTASNCFNQQGKCPQSYQGSDPPLLLISIDGFRPEYLRRGLTPTLNKIARCGTHADFMFPVFPSKTFPNHFSIVSGLNPESHGIIDNNMYDPQKQMQFQIQSPNGSLPFWYQGEPLWVTVVKQGKKSASYYWPFSEMKISETLPTYTKKYYERANFTTRVNEILEWLEMPVDSRPSFITLYLNEPDKAGHYYGIYSEEVNQNITIVDNTIEMLFNGLKSKNLLNCVNVIIVSDHGMADTDCKLVVDLNDYINVTNKISTMGPFGRIGPIDRNETSVVKELIEKLKCQSEHMRVYPKEQLPVRMHYVNNDRIEPIFLDMDNHWTVVTESVQPDDFICTGGAHGYDNLYQDMRAIFMAHGPSIKPNNVIRPFISTELYELMTELINITPNPNNGTRGSLHNVLKNPRKLPFKPEEDPPATGLVPNEGMEYESRINAANCTCLQPQKEVNLADRSVLRDLHLPFGVPYSSKDNSTLRMLYNQDNVIAFDLKYQIPEWVSFTINKKDIPAKLENVCFTGDARIPMHNTARCGDYNHPLVKKNFIVQRPLYSPAFSNSDSREEAAYVTNSIPKSLNHTNILETKMNKILSTWTSESGPLNVVMGPAFNLLGNGLKPSIEKIINLHIKYGPLVVPTHIFVVATWCSATVDSLKNCSPGDLYTNGFLLPNEPFTQNCETPEAIIQKNVARIVDIENLTGISFFTGLPIYDAIRLRTSMPRRSSPS